MSYSTDKEHRLYTTWCKRPYWTIEQGISLVLEQDPDRFKSENRDRYPINHSLIIMFNEMEELAKCHIVAHNLLRQPTPTDFLNWVNKMKYKIPQKLLEIAKEWEIELHDWKSIAIRQYNLYCEVDKKLATLTEEHENLKRSLDILKDDNAELKEAIPKKFTTEDPYYSTELEIANTIQQRIAKKPHHSFTPKQYAEHILKNEYKLAKKEAIERIATIVNPDNKKRNGN